MSKPCERHPETLVYRLNVQAVIGIVFWLVLAQIDGAEITAATVLPPRAPVRPLRRSPPPPRRGPPPRWGRSPPPGRAYRPRR